MKIEFVDRLDEVSPREWQHLLGGDHNPFLSHAFLSGLERHGCVGDRWGWLPRHILIRDAGGGLLAAAPMYVKHNSYGEFVFDWSWADAFARSGLRYYPKLVVGIPYTPATGPRLLVDPDADDPLMLKQALVEAAVAEAEASGASSVHWLFTPAEDTALLTGRGLARRTGCQYHWHNRGYRDFDDYLGVLSSGKRKKIRRERRRVAEAGITVEILDGHGAREEHWDRFHGFYRSTFARHGGYATLSRDFFGHLGSAMPDQVVLLLARDGRDYVAGALCLRSDGVLYGRHWGCSEDYHSLHFELCYYAGIEYCIRHGLRRFEPGAQGEHKVARGFEPTETWSAHWVGNASFAEAVRGFAAHEHELMVDYISELRSHLPFRGEETSGGTPA